MKSSLEQLFLALVPEKFDFLAEEYGFSLDFDDHGDFVARSSYCQISIVLEKKHLECWLERLDVRIFPYHGIEVVVLASCLGYRRASEVRFPSEAEILIEEIDTNARLLREYCSDFLRGDFSKWIEIVDCLEERGKSQELARDIISQERRLSGERALAQHAWATKDFIQVIAHYENIQRFLLPFEKKRLEYAKKRIAEASE